MDNPWQEVMDDFCEALMRLADRVEKALEYKVTPECAEQIIETRKRFREATSRDREALMRLADRDYRTERAIEEGQKYEHHLDRQKHSSRAVRAVRRSRRGIAKVQGCAGWGTTRPRSLGRK